MIRSWETEKAKAGAFAFDDTTYALRENHGRHARAT